MSLVFPVLDEQTASDECGPETVPKDDWQLLLVEPLCVPVVLEVELAKPDATAAEE